MERSSAAESRPLNLEDPRLFINRELSWLQFNARVLEEALDEGHPLLERVKFLAIFASNLDEFFMIRLSGLRRQLAAAALETPPDGMSPAEEVSAIRRVLSTQILRQVSYWHDVLLPTLHAAAIQILHHDVLQRRQRELVRAYFEREIFPILTPLAFDPAHPFPHISNLSMNLAVVVEDPILGERFARLKVPNGLPRLLRIPTEEHADAEGCCGLSEHASTHFVWMEDVIVANLDLLFPGLRVINAFPFRVTRDADLEIEEDEAADLLTTVEESIEARYFGSAIRLEIDTSMPERIRDILTRNLGLAPYLVDRVASPIGLADLMELTSLDRPDLKFPPFLPGVPSAFVGQDDLLAVIRARDELLYHPYESFTPVIDFLRQAARDPEVMAIKQTLYRLNPNSPIVEALKEARDNGKQVAVLVELKARFDEENNIAWARALEQAGVHVVYGVIGLKTHTKMCLVIRREGDRLVQYVHLGTGNYNVVTSRIYTDLGYFTANPDIAADILDLFNALTGYSRKESYRCLLVAPRGMREGLLARIERESARQQTHGDGYIAFKLNALVDKACIQALYRASQAGVRIDLQVRGICCLRPGIPGVSETITVTSIVGRFLEHARIYYFRHGGDEEVLLGSADLMPRNLDRRVELLFPVVEVHLRQTLITEILAIHQRDSAQARRLESDGTYTRILPAPGQAPFDSQQWMLDHRATGARDAMSDRDPSTEFPPEA